MPQWKTTRLWTLLSARARKSQNGVAAKFASTVEDWMEKIVAILKAGTAPLDFTLHDESHSFRVSERMWELMSPPVHKNLSDYEAALLLLSAYCHDIGMTPERSRIISHHRYLFSPTETDLDAPAKSDFQTFLDNWHSEPLSPPICTGTPGIEDLNLADEITAFYIRHRHNDWSALWIRENLTKSLFALNDARDVLIQICQSHHWSFDSLSSPDFDPRPVGNPPQILHLRYLACLLRIADILENDPERTPEQIFRHRDIKHRERSIIHWQKGHSLNITLRNGSILFYARPDSARVHKALNQLADWIDDELQGVAKLADKLPTSYCVGTSSITRTWHLPPALTRDIEPTSHSYEYVDGSFRPNTQRLIQLLSGTNLYGHPFDGVRELLQNAFDAVREKIARRRLEHHTSNLSICLNSHFGDEEYVHLTVERRGSDTWLICTDSGVGLTKAILSKHFLVSGQPPTHEVLELQRRCKTAGISLTRTGQFGIGALSYFMLASQMLLTTTRFQGCNDLDAPGWRFAIRGIDDFGELRRVETAARVSGTTVELLLHRELCEDFQEFTSSLLRYLKDVLVRVPCGIKVTFKTHGATNCAWERKAGWVFSVEDQGAIIESSWTTPEFDPEESLSEKDLENQRVFARQFPRWRTQAREGLKLETKELELPGTAGKLRLVLPFFDLPKGPSPVFLFQGKRGETYTLKTLKSLKAHKIGECAWKGMRCTPMLSIHEHLIPHGFSAKWCAVFVDLDDDGLGSLQINRHYFSFKPGTAGAIERFVSSEARAFEKEILSTKKKTYINLWKDNEAIELSTSAAWWFKRGEEITFERTKFPAFLPLGGNTRYNRLVNADGDPVSQIAVDPSTTGQITISSVERVMVAARTWAGRLFYDPVAYWSEGTKVGSASETQFPPEWNDVLALQGQLVGRFINPGHTLSQFISKNRRQALNAPRKQNRTYLLELQAAKSPEEAVWFLVQLLCGMFAIVSPKEFSKRNRKLLEALRKSLSQAVGEEVDEMKMFLWSGGRIRLSPELMEKAYVLPDVANASWILCEKVV